MNDAAFAASQARARKQASVIKKMKPAEISVDTWLGGYKRLFPTERGRRAIENEIAGLKDFVAEYGHRPMSSITAIEAQAWVLAHAPSQIRFLKEAWVRAVLMQVAPLNIWLFTVRPKRTKPKRRPPTTEELERIIETARAAYKLNLVNMIEVAAFTGARQAGLIRLRWHDVDMKAKRMTLTEKGDRTRTVVLPTRAHEALRRSRKPLAPFIAGTANPRIWNHGWTQTGRGIEPRPIDGRTLRKEWEDVRGDFSHGWHSLRHYCATWMAEQGVDPLDIAVQLGHMDSQGRPYARLITRTYDHPDPMDALERVAAAVQT